MGIKKHRKNSGSGIQLTPKKLNSLLLECLTNLETHLASDYKPEDEQWRQMLAREITAYVISRTKT